MHVPVATSGPPHSIWEGLLASKNCPLRGLCSSSRTYSKTVICWASLRPISDCFAPSPSKVFCRRTCWAIWSLRLMSDCFAPSPSKEFCRRTCWACLSPAHVFSVCKVLELDDNAAKETPEICRAKAIDPNGLMGADTHKISKTGLGQVTKSRCWNYYQNACEQLTLMFLFSPFSGSSSGSKLKIFESRTIVLKQICLSAHRNWGPTGSACDPPKWSAERFTESVCHSDPYLRMLYFQSNIGINHITCIEHHTNPLQHYTNSRVPNWHPQNRLNGLLTTRNWHPQNLQNWTWPNDGPQLPILILEPTWEIVKSDTCFQDGYCSCENASSRISCNKMSDMFNFYSSKLCHRHRWQKKMVLAYSNSKGLRYHRVLWCNALDCILFISLILLTNCSLLRGLA